ncbi:DedA family protein [Halalkalibacter wakoensis JCM 9140]|uniref:DedA family protein n=1 Tax=Halalkalibacter wakoensis JCM 9140 TaxID=1236970 RepID=W4PXB7_9BACI|nr:DedA family protein [Halalkalibacter wakoensis]GAE24476.1 DedA family protein [Halalkalibacter wakoensis JCM 9140]
MVDYFIFIDFIRQYGYIALFFIVAVGLFFFPVPNEILLMSGGLLATTKLLDPLPTFLILFSSILLHGTILYVIGYAVNQHAHFDHRKQSIWHSRAEKGRELLDEYGLKAASFSYFFPFIRHAVPFSIGMSGITYRFFALIGFSSAFIWLSIYFFIGFYYGQSITDWTSFVQQLLYALFAVLAVIIVVQFIKRRKQRQRHMS